MCWLSRDLFDLTNRTYQINMSTNLHQDKFHLKSIVLGNMLTFIAGTFLFLFFISKKTTLRGVVYSLQFYNNVSIKRYRKLKHLAFCEMMHIAALGKPQGHRSPFVEISLVLQKPPGMGKPCAVCFLQLWGPRRHTFHLDTSAWSLLSKVI